MHGPTTRQLFVMKVAMVVVCLGALGLRYATSDLERVEESQRPLALVLVATWFVVVLWTAGHDRTPGIVALMIAAAAAVTLPLWAIGYLGTPEAIVGGIVAAALGIFGPLEGGTRRGHE